jgi:hypothetical protein
VILYYAATPLNKSPKRKKMIEENTVRMERVAKQSLRGELVFKKLDSEP